MKKRLQRSDILPLILIGLTWLLIVIIWTMSALSGMSFSKGSSQDGPAVETGFLGSDHGSSGVS